MKCKVCGVNIVKIEGMQEGWIDSNCHKGYRQAKLITKYEGEEE